MVTDRRQRHLAVVRNLQENATSDVEKSCKFEPEADYEPDYEAEDRASAMRLKPARLG